ncbi:MAG: hypothetical protein ACK4GW_04985 [Pseudorhodobacter sp.]
MRFPALARQSEIDNRLTRARPRFRVAPSLPWAEALIGLSMLMILQSAS